MIMTEETREWRVSFDRQLLIAIKEKPKTTIKELHPALIIRKKTRKHVIPEKTLATLKGEGECHPYKSFEFRKPYARYRFSHRYSPQLYHPTKGRPSIPVFVQY